MADLVLASGEQIPLETKTRYKDMGDGTHALVVALGGASLVGSTVTLLQTIVDVGLISIQVLAANTSRKYCYFANDSGTVIYLSFGGAAGLNRGVRLDANGGTYVMCYSTNNLFTGAVYAISTAANQRLLINEGV